MNIDEWMKLRRDDLTEFHRYVIANPEEYPISEDFDWDAHFEAYLVTHQGVSYAQN